MLRDSEAASLVYLQLSTDFVFKTKELYWLRGSLKNVRPENKNPKIFKAYKTHENSDLKNFRPVKTL